MAKGVIPRPQADSEIDEVISYYSRENAKLADDFLSEIQRAFRQVANMPGLGSLRFAHELGMDGLRAYSLEDFPYLLFYFEREDHLDLVRMLHTHRDIFDMLLGVD